MSTFLDRAIGWISPARGLSRLEARARMAAVERVRMVYDGATTGRRSHGWRVAASDANSEIRLAAMRLRNVSRDMARNNPFASRAIQVIDQNVVGAGIVPSVKSRSKARAERIRDLIRAHLETTDCDVTGRHDLYGLQALVMRTIVESGEALVRRRYSADRKLALPFQMHVLEPDYLNALVDGALPDGGFAVQGIEFDARGKRIAYHLYDEHPGSARMSFAAHSTRVPAQDIAHVFRVDRPGQERGVTWFAPVILRMRDLADFIDAQLMRQKVAACFAGFVTSERDPGAALFAPDADEGTGRPIETVAPGMFEYLRPGEKIEFGAPPQVGDFDPYTRATQREIAVGLGVTYEALSGDLSQVNYSSGRMGWIEFQRSIDAWRWRMFIPQFCARVADWTLEAAGVMAPGGATEAATISWTPPRREMINPKEEVPTARDTIRAGLNSWSDEVRTLGRDPEEVAAEIKADQDLFDRLGVKLDSDGRYPANAPINATAPQDVHGGQSKK
ncbi:MAG: phage portal protein [Beijerinckiaceae bacterium]|nr:phage portal protein [Beijerinckiaceae bacterium]